MTLILWLVLLLIPVVPLVAYLIARAAPRSRRRALHSARRRHYRQVTQARAARRLLKRNSGGAFIGPIPEQRKPQ